MPFKHFTHQDFIDLAEENDTLMAVVNFFFRKRNEAKTGYYIAGGSYFLMPILLTGTALTSQSDPNEFLPAVISVYSTAFLGVLTFSTVNTIRYPKRELLQVIKDYRLNGKILEKYLGRLKSKDFPPGSLTKPIGQ
ncbi:hypothetical protein [Arthrospiribacter ruber]|uniref:Uncharacterized protein n=1 Tax=Arthrospiribacter ruber TaxID=2487934 RepID=A0A951J248_9BACT|nr:hypothetical protein [Arthrospiribacter ruber]MBW3469742.1 hypothetical protein [Arthrospiribacter ruber]